METRSGRLLASSTSSNTSGSASSRTPSRTASPASAAVHKAAQRTPSKPKPKLLGNPGVTKLSKVDLSRRNSSGAFRKSPSRSSLESILESIEVKQPLQEEDKPEPMDETPSKPPTIWKIYMNGVPARLHSIKNIKSQETIYHHERDADEPIQMTLFKGKVQQLENVETGTTIYRSPHFTQ